ncbi:hypothetical protein GPECTOR_23g22 [Gonium pectorale]|uniref:BACK domain-containing protein n=1 Tax=Gonium pectorale TaxID=33097 RepID=A0A150GI94_GONPE|nr:hypothetical protein GPECTOR_23g22 [Gonium pectorale]|eukprot:KXZ49090.1 hypothetical protein GPECTOR_23g22 [Gonium pectorale]
MQPLNVHVAAALGGLFGSEEAADCAILFVRSSEAGPATAGSKRSRSQADGEEAEPLAEPLPAHTLVIRYASGWFAAKLPNTRASQQLDGAAGDVPLLPPTPQQQHQQPNGVFSGGDTEGSGPGNFAIRRLSGAAAALPVLRVPLGGPEEVPAARAAVQFAYTGRVAAGTSVREALELYRQGQYLQVEGCGAACLAAIGSMLEADVSSSGSSGTSGSGVGGGGGSAAEHSRAAGHDSCSSDQSGSVILELYECIRLWPDPALEPAFASILSAAEPRLVAHFGDTLAVLNMPELRQQLLGLPAEGLEVLLESDNFGTDDESSILLLLATWVQRNGDKLDGGTVERLCRLVRLAQLSPHFARVMLPALACARLASRAAGAGGPCGGWFPITCAEAIHLTSVCTAAANKEGVHVGLLRRAGVGMYDLASARFSTRRRRRSPTSRSSAQQPSGSGRQQQQQPPAFGWSISQEELERQLEGLRPGGTISLLADADSGLGAISARGFHWTPCIAYDHDDAATELFMRCDLPAAYGLDEASLGGPLAALARIGAARLEVDRWRGDGPREVAAHKVFNASPCIIVGDQGMNCNMFIKVPLTRQQPAEAQGEAVAVSQSQRAPACTSGGSSGLLRAWEDYLHGGRMTGRLVVLP